MEKKKETKPQKIIVTIINQKGKKAMIVIKEYLGIKNRKGKPAYNSITKHCIFKSDGWYNKKQLILAN